MNETPRTLNYTDKDVLLRGWALADEARFAVTKAQDGQGMGCVTLQRHIAEDGRAYGVLTFALLQAFCGQRWFEGVLRIAEAHFFADFALALLLVPVDPETDQEKIAALVSYGYDPDREHITAQPDMFVLENSAS